jgi:Tfp pilus assembly protein PilF
MKTLVCRLHMNTQFGKMSLCVLSFLLLNYVNLANAQTVLTSQSTPTSTSTANTSIAAKTDTNILYHEESLPKVELSKEILYKVVASELAVQRGLWQSAYLTFLGLARQTKDPRFCQRATEIALSFHHIDEALIASRFWLSLAPTSELAHQYWYAILISKNQTEELVRHFSQLLKISSPEQFNALVYEAQHVFMTAKNQQASYVFLKKLFAPYTSGVVEHPNRVAPYIALANTSYALDLIDESKHYAERAVALDPSSELAILSLAQTLDNEGAIARLDHFIHAHPQSKEARLAYANFLIDEQKFDLALVQLEELNHRYPQQIQFIYPLANLHFKLEHDEAAQEGYLAFLNLAKQESGVDTTSALLRLSSLALNQHNYVQAQTWFAKIPRLTEKHSHYIVWKIQHALLLSANDQTETAMELLEETICQDGTQKIQILLTQSQILKTKHQLHQALQLLQIAKAAYPKSSLILKEYASITELLSVSKDAPRQTLVNH